MSLTKQDRDRLDKFRAELAYNVKHILGYPPARDFDYSAISDFLQFPINNVGDPFAASTAKIDTREFECEVLSFWAEQLRAPPNEWWGYVTNGGTEGNLYAMYLARELYPDGIVYFSQDTHYSVNKIVSVLNMRNIMIRSQDNGEIDYDDLNETIKIHRDAPPIIFANIGTTMTEAKDDIQKIIAIIEGLAISQRYIHSDAAMSGGFAPFLANPPEFDFADGADSIAISGHKFIGSPIPCGLVFAREKHVNRIARSIAYIGTMDTTISGSRCGFAPLMLWYAMKRYGVDGMRQRAQRSLMLAAHAEQKLKEIGVPAWRNTDAITVVFPQAPAQIQEKWQLATAKGISHIIAVPGVSEELIDGFVNELRVAKQQEDDGRNDEGALK
ncbi:MAG: histidine decarboxylase [Pseudomonadales bacterium]